MSFTQFVCVIQLILTLLLSIISPKNTMIEKRGIKGLFSTQYLQQKKKQTEKGDDRQHDRSADQEKYSKAKRIFGVFFEEKAQHAAHQTKKGTYHFHDKSLELLAGPTRLELATSGVTGRHSNQLNYDPLVIWWAKQGSNL